MNCKTTSLLIKYIFFQICLDDHKTIVSNWAWPWWIKNQNQWIWNHCFNCPSRFEKGLLLFIIQADFFVPQARPQCIFVQSLKTFLFPPSLCFRAKEIGCNNADHPDKYGHYREAKFTMTKHHWWWKVSYYSRSCLPEAVL